MHYGVKGRKRAGNSNRPKMQLVRFDHSAHNGVEIKFLNTLTSSGECLGVVGVVRSAFRVPCLLGIALFYARFECSMEREPCIVS